MLEVILTFGGIVGAFAVFDALLVPAVRDKLSEYLFGFHNVPVGRVEGAVARAFVMSFSSNEYRLSLARIFLWSLLMSPICAVLGDLILAPQIFPLNIAESAYAILVRNLIAQPALFLSIFALVALLSLPFDYWNAWVSRRIYFANRRDINARHLVLDSTISGLPVVLMYWFVSNDVTSVWLIDTIVIPFLLSEDGFPRSLIFHAYVYLPSSICSSLILAFLIRVLMSLFVLSVRLLLRLTTINRGLVLYTRAQDFPFTTAGFFFALLFGLIDIFT